MFIDCSSFDRRVDTRLSFCVRSGEAYCDCFLWILLTTLSACHHHARVQTNKRLRAALKEKDAINSELRRATQAKSDFLANMSHGARATPQSLIVIVHVLVNPHVTHSSTTLLCTLELRTPMHGIIAMSRELQDLIEPTSNVNDAVDIITSTRVSLFST
jgi:signal transduction histidine kinase